MSTLATGGARRRLCRHQEVLLEVFRIDIDKDAVQQVLAAYYRPSSGGPSWQRFLVQTKDSHWRYDLFRCESIDLKSHRALVVMGQFTRCILQIREIKTVPYVPLSHPFIGRFIGTIRRESPDPVFFWNANDLARKQEGYRQSYNAHRVHTALDGDTPSETTGELSRRACYRRTENRNPQEAYDRCVSHV
ncbi:MAG: integrase core domain-containing protein [Sedimenticolaceae bacterium]